MTQSSAASQAASRAPAELDGAGKSFRVGFVGAGFIAPYHIHALRGVSGARVAVVVDSNRSAAEKLARAVGGARTATGIDEIDRSEVDAVHVLTPPNSHAALAGKLLEKGIPVFLEKPMAVSRGEADRLVELAGAGGPALGVSHNFLFSAAYRELRQALDAKRLGPIDHIAVQWHRPMPQVVYGPWNVWFLRRPENIVYEIFPHALAPVADLGGGDFEIDHVSAAREVTLPTAVPFFRRWTITGRAGAASVVVSVSFELAMSGFALQVRGRTGSALVDFDRGFCAIDRGTKYGFDADRFVRVRRVARSLSRQNRSRLLDLVLDKAKLRVAGNPYQASIAAAVASFYDALRTKSPVDRRLSPRTGQAVVDWCERIIGMAGLGRSDAPAVIGGRASAPAAAAPATAKGTVLVIGGSGFIGGYLVRRLLESGYRVRVMSRSGSIPSDLPLAGSIEGVAGSMADEKQLEAAVAGADIVYHLARGSGRTWEEYVATDLEPTALVGRVCARAGVGRLIYTGTIDSFYSARAAGVITDDTPLDGKIERRNLYARSKAAGEDALRRISAESGLRLVICRPGIVIGRGCSPCHWGVGMWNGIGTCVVWGGGDHPLPFVLVEDVADGLVRMASATPDGRSYTLVDRPLMSARQYLAEIESHAGLSIDRVYARPWSLFCGDAAKWLVKVAVRHPGRKRRPSLRDCECRTHGAEYRCERARKELGWQPASDYAKIVAKGIHEPLDELLR